MRKRTAFHIDPRAALAASLLCLPFPSLAALDALMTVDLGGTISQYHSTTAAPNILTSGGATATLQFAGTPNCYGAACTIDGPAVGAYLGAGGLNQQASSTLRYNLSVTGGPGLVPIFVSGDYATINPDELPRGSGGTLATEVLRVRGSLGERLFDFQSICYNYPPENNEQGPELNCGSGSFRGSFLAASGTDIFVYMNAVTARLFNDAAPAAASAYLDPFFQIDPAWAATHPGYALSFDPGVGNGVPGGLTNVTPVPEPETLALILAGLLGVVARAGRRGRQPA